MQKNIFASILAVASPESGGTAFSPFCVNANRIQKIAVIGMGQMGGVFARGFLKLGYPVYPAGKGFRPPIPMDRLNREIQPGFILVATGEEALPGVLKSLPEECRNRTGILQNELLPHIWENAGIQNPTVSVVWFEKKKGKAIHPIMETKIYGPHASLVKDALNTLDIPANILKNKEELVFELVVKNLYILTMNIAGLAGEKTVGRLFSENHGLVMEVAKEVLALQKALTGKDAFDENLLFHRLEEAVSADPDHASTGRTAGDRLMRAVKLAEQHNLRVPKMQSILNTVTG